MNGSRASISVDAQLHSYTRSHGYNTYTTVYHHVLPASSGPPRVTRHHHCPHGYLVRGVVGEDEVRDRLKCSWLLGECATDLSQGPRVSRKGSRPFTDTIHRVLPLPRSAWADLTWGDMDITLQQRCPAPWLYSRIPVASAIPQAADPPVQTPIGWIVCVVLPLPF